jgi:hypothetical protein
VEKNGGTERCARSDTAIVRWDGNVEIEHVYPQRRAEVTNQLHLYFRGKAHSLLLDRELDGPEKF